jgi:hypothetical protein
MSLARLSWLSIMAHILCDSVCQVRSTGLVWAPLLMAEPAGRAPRRPSRTLLSSCHRPCWLDVASHLAYLTALPQACTD